MRVLVVDPGPHVGVALYDSESGLLNPVPYERGRANGMFNAFEAEPVLLYQEVEGWIHWCNVLVVEGFRISGPRATSANETIEMIGVLRFLAARHGKTFVEQTPTDAMTFVSGDKLKRLGWWTRGSDHARAASKHLVLYLARAGILGPELLLPSAPEGGSA